MSNQTDAPPERVVTELDKEAPKRVWLPEGVIRLAAVSSVELERVEGDWWVRESTRASSTSAGQGEALLREAARLVCGYCDGHFLNYERGVIRGAAGSGNWVHVQKDDTDRRALCVATGIYNKLEFDRAATPSSPAPDKGEAIRRAAEKIWERIDSEKYLTLPSKPEIASIIEAELP